MKILFLDNDERNRAFYRNLLRDISEGDDLIFFSKGQDLIDEFKKIIIPNQIHIDLLISEFELPDMQFSEILGYIRNSGENYSYHNFKLSSLPILLHSAYLPSDIEYLNVDLVIDKPLDRKKTEFVKQIKLLVNNWRRKIYDDLEVLGIGLDYDFKNTKSGYIVRVKTQETYILSKAFVLKQERLPYLWLDNNFFDIESSIEELDVLVNQYMSLPKEKLKRNTWENQLQDFFKRNPKFLIHNNYSQFWSQPKINIPNTSRFYKPDFIVKPAVSPELSKNWEIIDLKLPLQDFLQQGNFHKTFTSKFFKCLRQIKDYKEYFMDERNAEEIKKSLDNFHPKYPKLSLIIGRRNLLFEKQDLVHKNMNDFNCSDVYLLTYDEILEYQKRELERLMNNRIL